MTTLLSDIPARFRGFEVARLRDLWYHAKQSRILSPQDKQTIMSIANAALKQSTGRDVFDRREISNAPSQ